MKLCWKTLVFRTSGLSQLSFRVNRYGYRPSDSWLQPDCLAASIWQCLAFVLTQILSNVASPTSVSFSSGFRKA